MDEYSARAGLVLTTDDSLDSVCDQNVPGTPKFHSTRNSRPTGYQLVPASPRITCSHPNTPTTVPTTPVHLNIQFSGYLSSIPDLLNSRLQTLGSPPASPFKVPTLSPTSEGPSLTAFYNDCPIKDVGEDVAESNSTSPTVTRTPKDIKQINGFLTPTSSKRFADNIDSSQSLPSSGLRYAFCSAVRSKQKHCVTPKSVNRNLFPDNPIPSVDPFLLARKLTLLKSKLETSDIENKSKDEKLSRKRTGYLDLALTDSLSFEFMCK